MRTILRRGALALACGIIFLQTAAATLIQRLSFEQLTDTSELIVSGKVTNSWTAWDQEHKYIWTHYNLRVASTVKGVPGAVVEFAEPGGTVDGKTMAIAGSVSFTVGNDMVVFLSRMPNGYLRTAGWAQGKYGLDANGRLHAQASLGAEMVEANSSSGASLRSLDGMSLSELRQRVSARVRATQGRLQ